MRVRAGTGYAAALLICGAFYACCFAHAGGPRFVAGSTYFDPASKGQPVVWAGGTVSYFTDLGDLGGAVTNAQAGETVAAAAAVWNAVPTAAVSLIRGGTLAEDVNGASVQATRTGVSLPVDIQSTALTVPVGIVYDADGAVIDALFGTGASDPDDCVGSGVMNVVDNLASDGTIAHALILVNGRCTGTAAQLQQIQFQLIRAFGRILGVAWSQADDAVLSPDTRPSYQQLQGWPVLRPIDLYCGQLSTQCVPDALQLRPDDVASLSRLYPVTSANIGSYPGKKITAANTLSIHGSVYFRRGQGMQGVSVVVRPVTPGVLLPDDRYPVSAVSGFLFSGNHGNLINGTADAAGEASTDFGSEDELLQGFYDLTGIPMPPGATAADFVMTLEAVNPLYTGGLAVGPYALGSPAPSGTLPSITLHGLAAGMAIEQNLTVADSAGDLHAASGGTFSSASAIPVTGAWQGRVPVVGQAAWLAFPVLAGRHFTVEAQAMDEVGGPSEDKLRTVLGIWNGSAPEGSPAVLATAAPFNGAAVGVTSLGVDAVGSGQLLLGVADQRGDGRPDYTYHGRLLYAATVEPERLPLSGGTIQIVGTGFHPGMTVTLGTDIVASVSEITPTLIVATVPARTGPSGSLDLVVRDPLTNGIAIIAGGISYGSADNDTMSITTALPPTLNLSAGAPFTVRVFGPDQVTPIAGVPVTFSVLSGVATFPGCADAGTCAVTTSGDGYAMVTVVPGAAGSIRVRASLTNGSRLEEELIGVTTLAVLPMNRSLLLAPGAITVWTTQALVVQDSRPLPGIIVQWTGQGNLAGQEGSSITGADGLASFPFTAGPWLAGASASLTACIVNTNLCASFGALAVHPESETLVPVSGFAQSMQLGDVPAPVSMRLVAPGGEPVIGGLVLLSAAVRSWTPGCGNVGPCSMGRLLGTTTQSAVSDQEGLVSFVPGAPPGLAVRIAGEAEAGSSSTSSFALEIHP